MTLRAKHASPVHNSKARKEVVARHFTYSETAENLSILSIRLYVIVGREIALRKGETCFRYEWRS